VQYGPQPIHRALVTVQDAHLLTLVARLWSEIGDWELVTDTAVHVART
jgi:hypothetical protein